MNNILIFGCFGQQNFGDELMLANFLQNSNFLRDVRFYIVTKGNVESIKGFKNVRIINIESFKHKRFISKILIRLASCVLWVGGTCFTDQEGNGNYDLFKYAHVSKKHFGYIGVGVNRLTSAERIEKAKYLLLNASIITVRDIESKLEIERLTEGRKTAVVADDLACLDNFEANSKTNNEIVFAWRDLRNYYDHATEESVIEEIVQFLNYISGDFERIIFLATDNSCDAIGSKAIGEKLFSLNRTIEIVYQLNLDVSQKKDIIKNARLVVSARLHPAVISELYGNTTIALSYSDKIDYFMNSINKMSRVLKISELTCEKLVAIYKEKEQKVPDEVILEKRNNAMINISELASFLK